MTTIWKFPITTTGVQDVMMPKGAKILCIQTQNEEPCLWAEVESGSCVKSEEPRRITIHGTGHIIADVPDTMKRSYIGTYQLRGGALVFHVFELKRK